MLADDYYGFPRGLIARNFPPHPYNKTYEGWLEFERIYAIAYWLAAEGSYRGQRAMQLFDEHPEHFKVAQTFIIQGRRIVLYEVLEPAIPARLFKGTGTVAASENLLRVEFADEPEAETVLRYNWRDGLYCKTPGASIGPYPAGEHTPLIAVTPGEGSGRWKSAIGGMASASPGVGRGVPSLTDAREAGATSIFIVGRCPDAGESGRSGTGFRFRRRC